MHGPAHSFTSRSQLTPSNPKGQTHVAESMPSTQKPWLTHGNAQQSYMPAQTAGGRGEGGKGRKDGRRGSTGRIGGQEVLGMRERRERREAL